MYRNFLLHKVKKWTAKIKYIFLKEIVVELHTNTQKREGNNSGYSRVAQHNSSNKQCTNIPMLIINLRKNKMSRKKKYFFN